MTTTQRGWLIGYLLLHFLAIALFHALFQPRVARPLEAIAWFLGGSAVLTLIVALTTCGLASPLPYLSWLGGPLLLAAEGKSVWPVVLVGSVYFLDLIVVALRSPSRSAG